MAKRDYTPTPLGRLTRLAWLGVVALRGTAGSWHATLQVFKPYKFGGVEKLRGDGDTPDLAITRLEAKVKEVFSADQHPHD